MEKVIFLKQGTDGAVLRQINRYSVIVFDALLDAAEYFSRDYTITEGWRPGIGYHPKGIAWDVRANDLPKEHRQELKSYLKEMFPVYFDIVLEEFPLDPARDHFHIEVDAKKLALSGLKDRADISVKSIDQKAAIIKKLIDEKEQKFIAEFGNK